MSSLVVEAAPQPQPNSGAQAAAPAQRKASVWCLLLATGVVMGSAIPLSKQAVASGVGPISFVMFPALGTAVLLAVLAWWRHGPPRGLRRLALFGVIAGLLGNALPNTLVAWLSVQAGASITAIAYTLPPVFTLALSVLLGFETARWQRWAAVGLALAGALWLASSRVLGGDLAWLALAGLLAVPLSVGAGNVFRARQLPPGVPAEWLGAALSLGAFLLLLPLWWWGPQAGSRMDADGLPYLIAQVFAGAAGAVLFFMLQRRADAVTMSFVGYVIALTAVVAGAGLLGEQLPWQIVPAAMLIAAGFVLIRRYPAPLVRPRAH